MGERNGGDRTGSGARVKSLWQTYLLAPREKYPRGWAVFKLPFWTNHLGLHFLPVMKRLSSQGVFKSAYHKTTRNSQGIAPGMVSPCDVKMLALPDLTVNHVCRAYEQPCNTTVRFILFLCTFVLRCTQAGYILPFILLSGHRGS